MAGFFVIFYSKQQEIIITYGSDKWTHYSQNHKICYYDQIRKIVVRWVSRKEDNNKILSPKISCLNISVLVK